MADLTPLQAVSAGLYPEYETIAALEIEDVALGGGAFGQNYACRTLNHAPPSRELAIKILQDNGSGSVAHSRRTLQKLMERLRALDGERLAQNLPPLRDVPGLMGLPLFVFEARLQGRDVCGYGALRLDTLGYALLETFTEEDARAMTYLAAPLPLRLQMAADLAEAFALLDSIGYVHGDVNPPNLFAHPGVGHLALIDFDSGVIVEQPGDSPATWGKPGDWVAPEISARLASGQTPVSADRNSDLWSLGIGIHYALFLHHPLVYLNDFGLNTLRAYFHANLWPEIAPADPLFSAANAHLYAPYRRQVANLPQPVVNAFDVLLNQGTFAPDARPSGETWLRALRLAQEPPHILFFLADRQRVPCGGTLTLTWAVENADRVWLEGVGDVTGQTSCIVTARQSVPFRLTAANAMGSVEAILPPVQIVTGPRLRAVRAFHAPSVADRFPVPAGVAAFPTPVTIIGARPQAGAALAGRHLRIPSLLWRRQSVNLQRGMSPNTRPASIYTFWRRAFIGPKTLPRCLANLRESARALRAQL